MFYWCKTTEQDFTNVTKKMIQQRTGMTLKTYYILLRNSKNRLVIVCAIITIIMIIIKLFYKSHMYTYIMLCGHNKRESHYVKVSTKDMFI